MSIKSFNVDERTYQDFLTYCKDSGLSMSKQIEFFMRSVIEEEPKIKQEYIDKINQIRKQKSLSIGGIHDFKKRYRLQ